MGQFQNDDELNSLVDAEEKREKELINGYSKGHILPKRNKVINEHDIADLKILVNTAKDVNEVIREIELGLRR